MSRRRFTLIVSVTGLMLLGIAALIAERRATAAGDLTPREARKVIARMAGIELPSDAVRIKDISPMGNSAVVVAQVETAFRLAKGDDGKWRVAQIRTGDRKWEDVDLLVRSLNSEKSARARSEMETVATALKSFQRERGTFVVSDSMTVLIDHLNPDYLTTIIRVDPWHQPYQYEGNRSGFTLRSTGADGQPNTGDDIVVSQRAG
jgi:type II secretion system (T2SS) protein G